MALQKTHRIYMFYKGRKLDIILTDLVICFVCFTVYEF
jgi:hypothetical protein